MIKSVNMTFQVDAEQTDAVEVLVKAAEAIIDDVGAVLERRTKLILEGWDVEVVD